MLNGYLASGTPGIKRKRRCGLCDACSKANCGQCKNCKDMKDFGGSGRKKQCCVQRQCKVSDVSKSLMKQLHAAISLQVVCSTPTESVSVDEMQRVSEFLRLIYVY